MRLEKLLTHQIIRLLRLVLPVVVLILIAVPTWNYWVTFRQSTDGQKPEPLPKDLALRTENFTFSSTEGGRTIFTSRARTNLGTTDQKNMLEDVDVTIHGEKETDPPRAIKSKQCNYEQQTNNFHCTGNVQIQLDERTQVTTEEVTYNHTDRYISANKPVDL